MSSKAQMICVCGHCGKQCERRACKQCRMIAYCSPECQKADWPKHKKNCATMAETKTPEETEIFNQSKRFMALVDTVYYDGRRDDPSLYRHHLEHMIASYLQLQDDPYSMRVTPIVEINWGLVPMNDHHVLQIMDVQTRHTSFGEHPLAQNQPHVKNLMASALEKLHTQINALNERAVGDGHDAETGCAVPILNLSRRFTNHLSEITMLWMPFVTGQVRSMVRDVEGHLSPEITHAPGFALNLVGLLNGLLADDKRYRFRTPRLPAISAVDRERIQAGPGGAPRGRALALRVILPESKGWS